MAKSAKLLGSAIYEIQEVWRGQMSCDKLNMPWSLYEKASRSSEHPSESPNVMGLVGIHDPDALHHFNGLTHCPQCRKEGQN